MVTFAKRFRAFMSPPDNEWESLEELRQKTRETLSNPYILPEFKEAQLLAETSNDPFAGIFKPFGNAKAEEVTVTVNRKLERFSWRDVVVPVLMTLLLLGGVLSWQAYQQGRLQAVVSPFPSNQNASENKPAAEVVPPGTELEPGGPYTGTGNTQPSTNINGSGGVSQQTCPEGKICTGTDFLGNICAVDAPCFLITAPIGSSAGLITDGSIAADGEPCTPQRPCVLMHI